MRIGHASKDENGKATGGAAGDQTGKEVCIRNWYNGGWDFVARAKSPVVAENMATACEAACANPNVGYDKGGRNTLMAEAKKVNFDLSKIDTPCEADCSSLMAVCVAAAGITIPSGNAPTTSTLRKVLQNTGAFEILTDSKYLTGTDHLLRGDVLCKEGSHTVMALDDGKYAEKNSIDATNNSTEAAHNSTVAVTYYSVRLPRLEKGSSGPAVKNLQNLLLLHGEKLPKYGADGDFGDETGDAVFAFQKKTFPSNPEEWDRIVGPKVWAALITT